MVKIVNKVRTHIIFMIATLIAAVFESSALEPPKMQCLMLLDNNNELKVAWSNSQDCSSFEKYYFYVNGVLVDSMENMAATNGYNLCNYGGKHLRNFQQSSHYNCCIVAVDNSGNLFRSDTIKSISLTVTPNGDRTLATLTWEAPTSNLDQSWGNVYNIYKKRSSDPDFPVMPFASVPKTQRTYIDTSDVCNDTLFYQVGITNNYGSNNESCPFMTTIGSAFLTDNTPPLTPTLDSVSVTPTNEVILGFHENEPNMMGFIIYYETPNGFISLDTAYNQTFWIDSGFDPSQGTRSYRIAALDSCENSSPQIDVNTEMQGNMRLTVSSTDVCNRNAIVSWNVYKNMSGGIGEYEIFKSEDPTQSWVSAGTTQSSSFMLSDLELNKDYFITVKARNADGSVSASSNRVTVKLQSEQHNDFSYIRSVSVIDNRYIRIKVLTSGDTLPFRSITLQRSEDGVEFENYITYQHTPSAEYTFADSSASFWKKNYYYRAFLTDGCGAEVAFSNISHNILLKGEALSQSNSLTWQAYEGWDGGVSEYRLLRRRESDDGFSNIANVTPSSMNGHTDDVSSEYGSGSKFTYCVEAEEVDNQYGFSETSLSNEISLTQEPTLFIPNAFRPSKYNNNTFRPVNSFVSAEGYQMAIYARTGDLVFITTNPQEGWDGRIKGKLLPPGIYIYHIEYVMPDGSHAERDGTVTLVR